MSTTDPVDVTTLGSLMLGSLMIGSAVTTLKTKSVATWTPEQAATDFSSSDLRHPDAPTAVQNFCQAAALSYDNRD